MKHIRYFSDLHLDFDVRDRRELWSPKELETDKDTVLILAGDIWNGMRTVDWLSKFSDRFEHVLFVLGNHDYYGVYTIHTLASSFEYHLGMKGLKNVSVLHRDLPSEIIGDYAFIGSTLWTNMNKKDPIVLEMCSRYMVPDFTYIYTENRVREDYTLQVVPWTNKDWLRENSKDFRHIRDETWNNKDRKVIVITHHAPSYSSIHERYVGDIGNHYFASDYSKFILDNPNIKYWIHGHVHDNFNYQIGETRILVNPRGYPGENKGFDEIALIELGE